jgi:hypothetical protein
MAVFMPVPPRGVTRWAASPTRKVLATRNRSASWAAKENGPMRSIRGLQVVDPGGQPRALGDPLRGASGSGVGPRQART